MNHRPLIRSAALAGVLGAACFAAGAAGPAPAPRAPALPNPQGTTLPRPQVAVSIPPQKWLVEKLAADDVGVVVVVDAGANHETYQPTDRQATEIQRASLYFAIGLPMERARWFEAIRSRVKVVECAADVAPRTLEGHVCGDHDHVPNDHAAHDHGQRDPHVWTSPAALKAQARTMSTALAGLLPQRADAIKERLAALERELDALDEELRRTLAPCRGKSIFVFHPAWGYFTDAYGLKQVAIEQDGKAPTDAELTALQKQAREQAIKVVFVQPQISSRAASAVASAIGGRVEAIDPLAADVPSNLRRVATLIAGSCQ